MATKFSDKAGLWKARYELAADNQSAMFRKFSAWYQLMYAAINTKNYAPWRSKVFLPILASKAWTMVAKLTALKPGFRVTVSGEYLNDPDAQQKADKAQYKLLSDWNNPRFDEPMQDKLFSPLVDAVVTGTGVGKTPYTTRESAFKYRQESEGGFVDLSNEGAMERVSTVGYNDFIPVNIFNVFQQPGSTNIQDGWTIIKEYKSISELEESGLYDKKTLNQLRKMRADGDPFAEQKRARNQLVTSQDPVASDDTVDKVAIYECYDGGEYLCTFAEGSGKDNKSAWMQIREDESMYWHGKKALVAFYVRRRPFDFWGQGIFEDTERLQSAVNDVFNHFNDSYNLSVNGMVMKQEGEDFRYIVQPGGELTYRNQEPKQFKFPDPNPAIFQIVTQTIEAAIEDATVSSYLSGTPDSATDKTAGTASGIRSLQAAAGDKIGFMMNNFRTSLRSLGQMWLSNNRQFSRVPTTVMGMENSVPTPMTVTPADLQFDPVLEIDDDSMEPLDKETQLQKDISYVQQAIQLQQASLAQSQASGGLVKPLYYEFGELFKKLSLGFQEKDYDRILLDSEELAAQAQNQQDQQIAAQVGQEQALAAQAEQTQTAEAQRGIDDEIANDYQQLRTTGGVDVVPRGQQSQSQGLMSKLFGRK